MRRQALGLVAGICMLLLVSAGAGDALDSQKARKAEDWYEKGVKAARANQPEEAVNCFRKALEIFPLMPGAYVELGHIRMAAGNYPEAVVAYQRARTAYEQLHDSRLKEQMQTEWQKADHAQKGQDAADVNFKDSGGFAKQSVKSLRDEQAQDRRETLADRAEAAIPAPLFLFLGAAYLRQNELDAAENAFRDGLAREDLAPLHFNLAVVHLKRGRFQEAAAEANHARQQGFKIPSQFVQDLKARSGIALD